MDRFVIQHRERLDGGDDATAAFGPWTEHSRYPTWDAAEDFLSGKRNTEPGAWMQWRMHIATGNKS